MSVVIGSGYIRTIDIVAFETYADFLADFGSEVESLVCACVGLHYAHPLTRISPAGPIEIDFYPSHAFGVVVIFYEGGLAFGVCESGYIGVVWCGDIGGDGFEFAAVVSVYFGVVDDFYCY
ncbi:hypothetical protein D3C84_909520 [compost metagenome]